MEKFYYKQDHNIVDKLGMLAVYYTVHEPLCCAPHVHPMLEIIYFIDGKYSVLCDDDEFEAGGGDIVLFRSNSIHRMYCLTPKNGHYYVFHMSLAQFLSFSGPYNGNLYLYSLSFCHKGAKIRWSPEESRENGLSKKFEKLTELHDKKELFTDIAAKLCLGEIIYTMLCEMGIDPIGANDNAGISHSIYDAINYINRHYAENLTAEECSKRAAVSYWYFSRNFKRITGKTFKDYLNFVRIAHGDRLLLSTDLPVAQIAAECGFNSQSYFIAEYKRQKHITPLAFRKSMRKEQVQKNATVV